MTLIAPAEFFADVPDGVMLFFLMSGSLCWVLLGYKGNFCYWCFRLAGMPLKTGQDATYSSELARDGSRTREAGTGISAACSLALSAVFLADVDVKKEFI
ncbi:MAG: hypothetical protein V4495_05360 [Pseudomonadota bacterium]